MKRIRLVLADDHPIVLDGLEQLFSTEPDLEVVARATSAEGAVRALEEFRPDVLVLDLAMPGHDGIWVMEQAAARKLLARIVLLTAHVDERNLLDAVRLNVAGVVLKEMAPRLLVECVRKVHAGEKWLEKHSVARAMDRMVKRENELQRLSQAADAAGDGDRPPGGRRSAEQGDCRSADHHRGHGEDPPAQHLREAWRDGPSPAHPLRDARGDHLAKFVTPGKTVIVHEVHAGAENRADGPRSG